MYHICRGAARQRPRCHRPCPGLVVVVILTRPGLSPVAMPATQPRNRSTRLCLLSGGRLASLSLASWDYDTCIGEASVKLLLLFGAAIALVVLGARGTYKAVWNSFFPNEPITTTPVSTLPSLAGVAPSTSNTTGGQPGQTATNPVQVGQQAGTATKNWIGS